MNHPMLRWLFFVALCLAFLFFYRPRRERTLILAHNLDEAHPVHRALVAFQKKLKTLSRKKLRVMLYPNGQLGSERDVLELVQMGAVAMTKVSSMNLESFAPQFAVFNLPYIFRDRTHYYKVLDGPIGARMLKTPTSKLLRGLTYYDSGARSFYAKRPILRPRDLQGLKIRVMGSQMAIQMLQLLGGSPTPMAYGEIYTGLQQGVIDGAENNITALTLGRHGEVIKHFSQNEHTMLPDVLVMSERLWLDYSSRERKWIAQAAEYSKQIQRKLWQEATQQAFQYAAKVMKVKIETPDKALFLKKVLPLHQKLAQKSPEYRQFIEEIRALR